jgi:hypothetical protein
MPIPGDAETTKRETTSAKPRLARSMWRNRYLLILSTLYFTLMLVAFTVTAVDPYDLYPWGLRPTLARDRYDPNALPWLLNVIARSGYDTLVVGGSTAQQYRADDIRNAWPQSHRPFVLTYSGPRPADLRIVMDKTAGAPGLKRVLLSYDLTYLFDAGISRASFPFSLYDRDPIDDLREFGFQSIELSARLISGREYFVSAWDFAATQAEWKKKRRQSLDPIEVDRIRRLITAYRSAVDQPTPLTCRDFPAIKLIPRYAKALAARNVRLDVVIPPYSYAMYFDYLDPMKRHTMKNGPPLSTLLLTRRCLLESVQGLSNVRVFAFDLTPGIADDMDSYRDTVHLFGNLAAQAMLRDIELGRGQLTLENFDHYQNELRRRVTRYQYFNSGK